MPFHNCASSGLGKALVAGFRSPNEYLKHDAGCDLWAVGHRFPEEAVAVVFIIGVEIAEADFGIDAPRDLAAERSGALRCDVRTDPKPADVHLARKVKSFGQVVAPTNPDIRISPTFGETKSTIEHLVQSHRDFRLRRYRVLPGRNDELEQFRL